VTSSTTTASDRVLLDTDVFSFLLKGKGDNADRYRRHVNGKTVAVSFITIGEIYAGLFKKGVSQAALDEFEAKLHAGIVIIPYNLDICVAYGRLSLEKTAEGSDRTIAPNDRWIAACALHHRLPLVTNNARHFEGITGLTVITEPPPASSQRPLL
jgi:predicted nucleic acid-binding protein